MAPLASLWLPIVVSAVSVFFACWISHMFLPFHRNVLAILPQEDPTLDALPAAGVFGWLSPQ